MKQECRLVIINVTASTVSPILLQCEKDPYSEIKQSDTGIQPNTLIQQDTGIIKKKNTGKQPDTRIQPDKGIQDTEIQQDNYKALLESSWMQNSERVNPCVIRDVILQKNAEHSFIISREKPLRPLK